MKKQIIWFIATIVVAALATWLIVAPSTNVPTPKPQQEEQPKTRKFSDAKPDLSKRTKQQKQETHDTKENAPLLDFEDDESYSPEEKTLAATIQNALDEDDFKRLQAEIEKAANSTNDALREKAVEALAWFGAKALPELTLFMVDPNDDVRTAACNAWTMSISEVKDVNVRASSVVTAMTVVHDRGQLDSMVMEINDMPTSKQISVLRKLIDGKNKQAAETAREHYEFVTGEPYKNAAETILWLQKNPDDTDDTSDAEEN